jgi:type IV pilus assembly protein PilA
MHSNQKSARPLKVRRCGGFTLIEMLIVVAVIAILVAVAIPIVSSALNKTKIATDQANERSAKAAATLEYLQNGVWSGFKYFDVNSGKLTDTEPEGYGKCSDHNGMYLIVSVAEGGESHAANGAGSEKLEKTETGVTIYWFDPKEYDFVGTHNLSDAEKAAG